MNTIKNSRVTSYRAQNQVLCVSDWIMAIICFPTDWTLGNYNGHLWSLENNVWIDASWEQNMSICGYLKIIGFLGYNVFIPIIFGVFFLCYLGQSSKKWLFDMKTMDRQKGIKIFREEYFKLKVLLPQLHINETFYGILNPGWWLLQKITLHVWLCKMCCF